jgi:hypothetical protein
MLQMGTNIMANQVKTPIQNYFEKVLYGNLAFEIPPLWFFRVDWKLNKNRNKPLWSALKKVVPDISRPKISPLQKN